MEVVILDTPAEAGEYTASLIASGIASGEIAVLGVATGSSPLPVYQALAARSGLHTSGLRVFALDEYVGLPPEHPQSYRSVVDREITRPLGLLPANVRVPDGTADDLAEACRDYEEAIALAGGIDLQLLGIGSDGHIGFNEPTSSLASRTRVKTLTPTTRADNARFFASPDDVPTHCITQGLGTIADASRVVLIAHGRSKAAAIARAVEGPVSALCPASALQLHERVTVVVDREAASELTMTDYYRFAFDNRDRV